MVLRNKGVAGVATVEANAFVHVVRTVTPEAVPPPRYANAPFARKDTSVAGAPSGTDFKASMVE
jgi:hypothetical protein